MHTLTTHREESFFFFRLHVFFICFVSYRLRSRFSRTFFSFSFSFYRQVMGLGTNSSRVYIIDFGLSNHYRDSSGKHIPYKEDASFHGTHRYASVNSHFRVGMFLSPSSRSLSLSRSPTHSLGVDLRNNHNTNVSTCLFQLIAVSTLICF